MSQHFRGGNASRGSNRVRVNPGRVAAARSLLAVEQAGHLEDHLRAFGPPDPADRALAWHLALGVLRQRPALDAIACTVARRTVHNFDPEVLTALRLGIFELRYSRVPPHAAVDQAVELCRAIGAGHATGLVNAVLRRQADVALDPDLELGHPAWLIRRWRGRYGADADVWMRANNQPATTWLVPREDEAGVIRAFQHAGLTLIPERGALRLPAGAGAIEELPGFAEGRWWVMDPAALAVADLVPDVPTVLDTCAAPGGKSFRLAARGQTVLATDISPERLERVRSGAQRLGLTVQTRVHDWAETSMNEQFPAVLVDAPCTSLGILRRHPEIRWRRRPEDIPQAALRQRRILTNAAACVAPGGALIYAVCSPEPEEGPEVAASVSASLGWPIEATFNNAPGVEGADVFWACRLRRPGQT